METMRQFERSVFLMVIDNLWKDHLYEMDHLKGGVQYRAFGQKNPLFEYQREGLKMFEELRSALSKEVTNYLFRLERVEHSSRSESEPQTEHGDIDIFGSPQQQSRRSAPAVMQGPVPVANRSDLVPHTIVKSGVEVGRNDPCPCGSGKKYKKCHGAL
jgi:preprotein translocase subunit SecA